MPAQTQAANDFDGAEDLETMDLEIFQLDTPPDLAFLRFKLAALLVGNAAMDADNWRDVTIHLENAFFHPLYQENREGFAQSLADALTMGIETTAHDHAEIAAALAAALASGVAFALK